MLSDEHDIDVVGTTSSADSAPKLAEALQPSVAIVGHRLIDGDGVATARAIRTASPSTNTVLLADASGDRVVAAAIGAGCCGYLTKDMSVRELVMAVHLAHVGSAYLSPADLAAVLPRLDRGYRRLGSDLTARELQVLQIMTDGLCNKDIASRLHLSLHTVRNHVQNVLVKLGAHSKLEAVIIANREALAGEHSLTGVTHATASVSGDPSAPRLAGSGPVASSR